MEVLLPHDSSQLSCISGWRKLPSSRKSSLFPVASISNDWFLRVGLGHLWRGCCSFRGPHVVASGVNSNYSAVSLVPLPGAFLPYSWCSPVNLLHPDPHPFLCIPENLTYDGLMNITVGCGCGAERPALWPLGRATHVVGPMSGGGGGVPWFYLNASPFYLVPLVYFLVPRS